MNDIKAMDREPSNKIRLVNRNDLDALKKIIDSNDLFPSKLLDEMIQPYFENSNTEFWVTYEDSNTPVALAYYAPERMTVGTYNLYLIAVHPNFQGKSIGQKMLQYIENHLKNRKERILLIETSGLPEFENTVTFYKKNNYEQEAIIREFYAKGEDKIIFWKALDK